jgi:ribosomal protein S30
MNRSSLCREVLDRDGHCCQNCGLSADHAHHVVPLSLGGNNIASNMISLCDDCHGKVHGIDMTSHRALTKAGLQAARERGVKIGGLRPGTEARNAARVANAELRAERLRPVLEPLVAKGYSLTRMGDELARHGHLTKGGKGIAPSQVRRYVERLGLFSAYSKGPGEPEPLQAPSPTANRWP